MNRILIIFFLFICAVLPLHAQEQVPLESFIDEKSQTIINYPRNWDLDQTKHAWMNFTLFPPVTPGTQYPENFTLTHQHLTDASATLPQIGKLNKDLLHTLAGNVKVINNKAVKLNNIDAWLLEYTGELKKGEGSKPVTLHWKHHYMIIDGTLYTLTFICEEANHKKLGPVADQISGTFRKI